MKILYITFSGQWADPESLDEKYIDFAAISGVIKEGILSKHPNAEITVPLELLHDDRIPHDRLKEFDLVICDVTASIPQVHYLAGIVEGLVLLCQIQIIPMRHKVDV